MKADTTTNVVDPSSPTTGSAAISDASAMHTVPTTTQSCDSVRVGQRCRNHSAPIARQQIATHTARA